jgi:CRISPR system Cascade subunit CasD
MSDTLAFLIDAPLQSWGAASKFQRRETESWPTKSSLVGVLAAALGIDKHAPDESEKITPLAGLCFSVFRWHKPAPVTRLTDFHTIGGGYDKTNPAERLHIPRKAGDGSPFGTVITRRTYLTDARFIALFQGDRATLEHAAAALLDPVWGVWFGRKTCIPAEPLSPVVAASPREAFAALLQKLGNEPAELPALEGMTESPGDGRFYQADQPVAFGRHHGAIPAAYLSRPVRRLAPGEMP